MEVSSPGITIKCGMGRDAQVRGRRRRMSKKEKLSMVLDVVKMNNVRTVKIPLNWAKDG